MRKTAMILSTVPDERLEMVLNQTAELGYRTVFCGEDSAGISDVPADVCYVIPWDDTKSLLAVADREKIDGVIGLVDKAMIPVSEISEAMMLPGNSPDSINRLLQKGQFRDIQKQAGVFCPAYRVVETEGSIREACDALRFPVIVKPQLCSSSFGQTVLQDPAEAFKAVAEASRHSRNGRVCMEEYIQQEDLSIIEMDVFVMNDEILWDGIRENWRFSQAPLRPVYDVYPPRLTEKELKEIQDTTGKLLKAAGVRLGEYNIEGFFTKDRKFFVVEINPRQAGHYNPQDIELYCGVNLTKLLVTTAVGDNSYYESLKTFPRTRKNLISYSVFSLREGILDHVYIDPTMQDKLRAFRFLHGQKNGDHVLDIHHAKRPIAKAVFEFNSEEQMEEYRRKISELVYPVLCC